MAQLRNFLVVLALLICAEAGKKKGKFWWEENYPNLSCHSGFDKDSNSSGKNYILSRAEYCYNSNSWGCFKACMLREIGILEEVDGKRAFRKDMVNELRSKIFTDRDNDSAETITRRIVTDCSEKLERRNEKKKPPTCQKENSLFMCIEKSMRCAGVKPKKGKLITPVCHPEVVDHYYIPLPDNSPDVDRRTSQYPSTVSCEWENVKPTKEALTRFAHIRQTCNTDLRGCFKRCIFEHFGILKFVHAHNYTERLSFTPENYMVKILKSNLFVIPDSDSYEAISKRILGDCKAIMQALQEKKKSSCVDENALYMCIEKAMACPEAKLERGPIMTTACKPEEYEYYYHPKKASKSKD